MVDFSQGAMGDRKPDPSAAARAKYEAEVAALKAKPDPWLDAGTRGNRLARVVMLLLDLQKLSEKTGHGMSAQAFREAQHVLMDDKECADAVVKVTLDALKQKFGL